MSYYVVEIMYDKIGDRRMNSWYVLGPSPISSDRRTLKFLWNVIQQIKNCDLNILLIDSNILSCAKHGVHLVILEIVMISETDRITV